MGGDCCGNVPATPADQLSGLSLDDQNTANGGHDSSAGKEANGPSANSVQQQWQHDFSPAEFRDFSQKRLNLFDEYKKRQDEQVSQALLCH